MLKFFAYLLIGLFIFVIFFTPARNYMNNFFLKGKAQLKEEQIIGRSPGYSPVLEEIQRILKEAHFNPGPADGVMGTRTRRAIREFQKEKGLWPNGKVDSRTWDELKRAKEALREEAAAQPPALPSETVKAELPGDRKKQIQIALQRAGFYKGKIDGKIGPQTKEAIKAFQKAGGLKIDGSAGARTWAELNKYLEE